METDLSIFWSKTASNSEKLQLHSPYFTIYLRNECALAAVLWAIGVPLKSSPEFSKKNGGLIGKY